MNISQSQVEECFGKGAVRAARVQHAVLSSTCMDWCTAVFTTIIVVCVAAATEWIAEQINHLEEQAERVIASIALIGVPMAIVLLLIKVSRMTIYLICVCLLMENLFWRSAY